MQINSVLKQYFGYESFREGQEQLINSAINGQDCLGIMPTGAGKSICFQVPALILSGITLIISPLISLMKDQVNALTQAGIKAAFINSSLTERQISLVLERATAGAYKLIYVAPERLFSPGFLSFAQGIDISMLTVDEAHCISQWGQDFRPSYAKIPDFLNELAHRPIVSAFTATATPKVREDVLSILQLQNPTVLVTGFDRENLYFEVRKPEDKFKELNKFLSDKKDKCGIIYCSTRNAVEDVCQGLIGNGYSASRYHAGLADRERQQNQDDFIYDRVLIMVATNAFGMGIDKSNVSFVVHYNMPKDLESYYQEAGRAGRDGAPANCILLYSGQDVRTNTWLIENSRDTEYQNKEMEEALKERERRRLREMTFYCTSAECLRAYILKYFGENPPNYCGNCSSCNTSFEAVDVTASTQKILSCVNEINGRFGVKIIVDVLRGSKNEKIMRLALDRLTAYNSCKISENQLRDIINYLILNQYLVKTDDEFPRVLLGERADEVLHDAATLSMRLPKEEKIATKSQKSNLPQSVDTDLFAALRALRLTIATEQKVPSYVIFPDSTLIDMCVKLPENDAQMLRVSGVGDVKLQRYGTKFLNLIAEYKADENTSKNIQSKCGSSSAKASEKSDLEIEVSDEAVSVSVIADRINTFTIQSSGERTSGVKLNEWLVSEGYLQLVVENTKTCKLPTAKGIECGIICEERLIRGVCTKVNSYTKAMQKLIISQTDSVLAHDK